MMATALTLIALMATLFLIAMIARPYAIFTAITSMLDEKGVEPADETIGRLAEHPRYSSYPIGMGMVIQEKTDPQWPEDEDSSAEQIATLQARAIPEILERLPSDGSHSALFEEERGQWVFHFKFISLNARFAATGSGHTPKEAFIMALHVLNREIREWHEARSEGRVYVASSSETLWINLPPEVQARTPQKQTPRVLIVDDDKDVALALEAIFRQFGCQTEVVTETQDLHRLMSFEKADFIVLDWMLSERVRANQVVEKAIRLIDTFSDLREKFSRHHPKIVTYSVLDETQVSLPMNQYFDHADHWQKPIQFSELTARTSELLETFEPAAA